MNNKNVWKIFFRKKIKETLSTIFSLIMVIGIVSIFLSICAGICFSVGYILNIFNVPVPKSTTPIPDTLWHQSINTGIAYLAGVFIGCGLMAIIIYLCVMFVKWIKQNWRESVIEANQKHVS